MSAKRSYDSRPILINLGAKGPTHSPSLFLILSCMKDERIQKEI
jgi:hypothetical protein